MALRCLVLLVAMLGLSACATDAPMKFACRSFNDYRVALPVTPGGVIVPGEDALATSMQSAFAARRANKGPQETNVLILSGGGAWGAYGAGLYDGWGQRDRPQFDIVTGVSTGAMQATFAFLGKDKELLAAYDIDKESDLVDRHGDLFFLTHGSTASLTPLRARIRSLAGPLMQQVADEGAKGRLLYVGVINALDGKMYAIDLTKLARSLKGEERIDCYMAALMSSAAIPAVFRQVTVGDEPYYDGGVRNSVFITAVMTAQAQAQRQAFVAQFGEAAAIAPSPEALGRSNVYILMNGVPGVPEISKKDGIPAALIPTLKRVQQLVFDQIEQSSVFATYYTASQLWETQTYVATAAGHTCTGEALSDEDIFDPEFMDCMAKHGHEVWMNGASPWKAYPGS